MGKTSRISAIVAMAIVAIMLLAGVPAVSDCPPCEPYAEVTLWAAQDIDVGTVTAWHDNENIMVMFTITDTTWRIIESHVHVASTKDGDDGIPQTKPDKDGNTSPKIGKFEYSDPDQSTDTMHKYIISIASIEGFTLGTNCLFIAAHAVVAKGCGETYEAQTAWGEGEEFGKSWAMYFVWKPCGKVLIMPSGTVDFYVTTPGGSYFQHHIVDGGGNDIPDGTYEGWCFDSNVFIYPGSSNIYTATLMSSYDPFLPDYAQSDYWPEVNWILNYWQGITTNWNDVQSAFWWYSDGDAPTTGGAALISAASSHSDFYPGSGQLMAILVLAGENVQLTFLVQDP